MVHAVRPLTNEGGVDGRTRFLRNVGGLWLLQESMRTWPDEGSRRDLQRLLDDAAALPSGSPIIDVHDNSFIPPGDMPARINAAVVAAGAPAPESPAALVRCILDSLAHAYAITIRSTSELTGRSVDVVHIVGGGSQNALLCQLTANATGRPVVAGPVEATALGHVVVQARSLGMLPADREERRALVAASNTLRRYDPS